MRNCFLIIYLAALLLPGIAFPQNPVTSCGQKEVTDRLFINNPHLKVFQQQIEKQLQVHALKVKQGLEQPYQPNAVVTLPVVVHIIHNNGTENISNAQVFTAIQHLNEAFANTGYYDPADGVNTEIQFCLAQRDPNNNPTNGIDRVLSPLTVMDGWNNGAQDIAVKNLSRWDPRCYINIWIVKDIIGPVAGYAYLPSAHGMDIDGIVGEAAYFGSSNANDVLIIHEMGHYLGLYHTFQGGCTNNDCTKDGDQVCDTPPDQSTAGISCNSTANSCSTDALSGFSSDVNDLHTDYLDYGNWNCMKVFTQGQATRMNWMIQNVRRSLLACKSCMTPCPTPVIANFSSSGNNVPIGTTVNFTNSSANASGYKWYINNTLQTTTTNFSYSFNSLGTYIIKLSALTNNPLCDSAVKFDTIRVICPVTASFTPGSQTVPINTNINFTGTSTGASTYQWLLNGVSQSGAVNYPHLFASAGYYEIKLRASNGLCYDSAIANIYIIDTTTQPPVDSCGRSTFQKTYSTQNSIEPTCIEATADGGTIIGGETHNQQRPQVNAFALKLRANGDVEWLVEMSEEYLSLFNRIRQTKDGGYIGVGKTTSFQFGNYILLVRLSPTGSVLWSKRFRSNPLTSSITEEGTDVIELSDGRLAITGFLSESFGYKGVLIVTDANGNINWSKRFRSNGDTEFHSVIEEGNQLIVTADTRNSPGNFTGIITRIDKNSGTPIVSMGFEMNAQGNVGSKIFKTGYGYFVSTFIMHPQDYPNKHLGFLRLDNNLNTISSQQLVIPFAHSNTGSAPLGDTSIFVAVNSTNKLLLANLDPSSAPFERWKKTYGVIGVGYEPINPLVIPGGYLMGAASYVDIAGGQKNSLLVVKTDLLGNTPGCETGVPLETITAASVTNRQITWNSIEDYIPEQPTALNLVAVPFVVTVNANCVNCDSTVVPPDTCGNITFQKKIGTAGADIAYDIKVLPGNEYLVAGSTTLPPTGLNTTSEALLLRLNSKGKIVWQKMFKGARGDGFSKIVLENNNEFFVFGSSYSNNNPLGSMLLTKFQGDGNLLWSKEFSFVNSSITGFIDVGGAIHLVNGDLAFCANANGINTDVGQPMPATYNIIGVISPTGTLRWVKRLREYYIESGGFVKGIVEIGGALFIAADYGIIKMNTADGSLMGLQKKFQNLGSLSSIEVFGSQIMAYSNTHQLVFDQSLNLVSAFNIVTDEPGYTLNTDGFSSQNGSDIQGYYGRSNVERSNFLLRTSGAGIREWAYRYPYFLKEWRNVSGSQRTNDNGTVSIGTIRPDLDVPRNEPSDIYILRTDADGRINDCPRSSANILLQPVQGIYIELFARNYPITTNIYNLNLQMENPGLSETSICNTANCNVLNLIATDTVCRFTDTFQVKAIRDTTCAAFTEWIVDTTVARIISQNDTLLNLQFKKSGVFTIYARLTGGCRLLQDSVTLTVFNSPDSVNLGPDIQLCKISTYTLKAGAGFKSYQWQDGSSDSTLTIYYPGIYHVTAEDYCGNLYRDTVVVSQSPDIPFDLGPDLKKCNDDTLTITAPVGFNKYYWSPGYRVDSLYSRIIKVSPDKDTTYIVIAERAPGCLVTDSIRVTVNHSIPLHLGNDTSFCQNDSITINATAGFTNYQWNTGDNTQSIRVHVAGQYNVSATDSNGCISRDSLEILPLYILPAVNIGADLSVCRNIVHEFDAGNFTTYLWQDGSANRRFSTSQTGTYWVRVSDANGCVNQDTATIIGYLENPKDFLDSSADICEGQLLEIKAKVGYNRYRWFNNSSSTTINVTAPGIYWVEVTNAEGCTTRDSISIKAKDCIKGIFFPNAFTPSNGGKNNFFRPVVNGQLESFYLIVYNRYGQKVFETRDAFKGWDGKINGLLQGTNTFAWSAIYKFSGVNEKQQSAKGTVTLIR